MFDFRFRCATSRIYSTNAGSTSTMNPSAIGGTDLARNSPQNSGAVEFNECAPGRTGNGILTRCSSKSTAKPSTCGALLITKAKCWTPSFRNEEIVKQH